MCFVDEEAAGYNDVHVVLNPASHHRAKRPREESDDDRAEEHGFKRAKFGFGGLWSVEAGQLLANDTISYLLFDTPSSVPSVHDLQATLSDALASPYRILPQGTWITQSRYTSCPDLPFINKYSWRFKSRSSEWTFIQATKDYVAKDSKQNRGPNRGVREGPFAQGPEATKASTVFVSDELLPITALTDPIQLAHAFKGTIRCHECLVRIPNIMHGDISLNNLAYRQDEDGKTYGVLFDFDKHKPPTPRHLTGTKAFLAVELLNPSDIHLAIHTQCARYDLESFLYVFAWIIGRYEGGQEISSPPYSAWTSGRRVEESKWNSLIRSSSRKVTSSYQDFIPILHALCTHFYNGFRAFSMTTIGTLHGVSIFQETDGQPFDYATQIFLQHSTSCCILLLTTAMIHRFDVFTHMYIDLHFSML
ncbi:hypothetical protein VNI00_008807 [Paramarasmius palmivorus]|uniref:Fungal-type protein kinase domain-containing protein n=1 Tax=Paramarasmius palmivorus TaxID=297713 RepID=A0AAW0CWU9_9AGAR